MNKLLNRWAGPGPAAWLCWALALGAVALAFLGAERAGAWMEQPVMQVGVALLTLLFGFVGVRAVLRRRFDSALLHVGCACVMAGWLMGRYAVKHASPDRPCVGSMVMVDGEETDRLWEGPMLDRYVGRVPFSVRLERFFVERYERNSDDRDAGRDAPVREYRSRVTITEPGRAPYVANVRVNEPVFVRGYHIYQMSWGHSTDRLRRPVVYTVLQVIRDPGLKLVYAGFTLLFAGILLFAWRIFRLPGTSGREVPA
ncbi:MAG TPA: cytochrome c biogenesis protein ResB [Kiritimatiellia bacterium]|nr:cytochrome c biogenesis protein ResB [Kiritimatiellia bacterium]HRU71409.1 cytochrome c biogenesis protein ResB [Kiritimatiellia bacterium]